VLQVCMCWNRLLHTSPNLLLGADNVSVEYWNLITALHDEGDGLTLCG
jgi:hypothetical protein